MRTISNSISRFGLLITLAMLPAFASADAPQYVQWGNQMMAQKQYDNAQKYFSGAIKEDPNNAAAYKGMGYAYVYKGDQGHALRYLKYALQLNPNDAALSQYVAHLSGGRTSSTDGTSAVDLAYQNGIKYMQAKQYQYAAYYFNQATTLDPNSAKGWQGLGNAFYQQGNKDKAIQAWNHALEIDPSNTQLSNYVASIQNSSSTQMASAAPSPAPQEKHSAINPWVMGGTIAALGAVMLFLF